MSHRPRPDLLIRRTGHRVHRVLCYDEFWKAGSVVVAEPVRHDPGRVRYSLMGHMDLGDLAIAGREYDPADPVGRREELLAELKYRAVEFIDRDGNLVPVEERRASR